MPSYVNIGAYGVDEGTMVDAGHRGFLRANRQNVHLSGGVGIGGVLEPLQKTIIEDNCFIGARSEVVEGVIVGEGSVISMGVYIGQSTKIYDRETGEVSYGPHPAWLGGGVRATCHRRWQPQPVLRGDRQKWTPRPAPRPASTSCCAGCKPAGHRPDGMTTTA